MQASLAGDRGRGFRERQRLDEVGAHRTVREILQTFTAPFVVELRKRLTDDTRVLVDDYDWLLLQEPWHRGRVVLIGDSAHATTAHLASGGGMAIEDAVVLGQEVAAVAPCRRPCSGSWRDGSSGFASSSTQVWNSVA